MSIETYATRLAHGEELQFRTSRGKLVLLFVAALAFTLIGLGMIGSEESILWTIFGWITVIFFGIGALVFLGRMLAPAVVLRISAEQGVWTRRFGHVWIPWTGIAEVERLNPGGGDVLALAITDAMVEPTLG